MFANQNDEISRALSLVAGFFSAFLVMLVSGIIKEFSIKTGLIEVTSKLQQDIKNVKEDVTQSKEEIPAKIEKIEQKIENKYILLVMQPQISAKGSSKCRRTYKESHRRIYCS